MKKFLFLGFILSNTLLIGQEELKLDTPIPVNPDVKIGTLENGLKYYIRKNGKPENKVSLRLAVNAGSNLETDEQQGLAHFMEHMNFNGTKNFQHNELVDYLQSIGVKFGQHLNAYTSFDETVYMLPIPSDDPEKLEKGFDILEDWAFNCLLTPEEIDKERGVVLEELRLGLGADKRMLDRYLPLAMYNSRYAERLPIGKKEILENFDHQVLIDFYKNWYRPNLMAVCVVGDIDVAEIEQKIKEHFAPYKNPENAPKREEFLIPNHDETFVAIETDPEASRTTVQLVYKDNGSTKPDKTVGDYKGYVVEKLFGIMLNGRLQEIRNNPNPPFTYGYAYHGAAWSRNKAVFLNYALTSPENQVKSLEALVTENERVLRHGFISSELERAKKELLAGLESSLKEKDKTKSNRLIGELVNNFLNGEIIPGIEWEYETTEALSKNISLDDVNGLIRGFIHDSNRVVIFTGPEGEGVPKYTREQVLEVLDNVKRKDIAPYVEEELAKSLLTTAPKPGSIKSSEKLDGLDFTKLTLSNGATVFYKQTDFNDNEILMRAHSAGGTSLIKSPEEYKKVSLALDGLSEAGLNGFSKNDMTKIQAGKEVSCAAYIGEHSEGLRGKAVNKDLEELFQLIYLNFSALNKDEEAYNTYVSKSIAYLGNLLNMPEYWYMNEKAKFIFEKKRRHMNLIPTAADFEIQDYNQAYNFYQERFGNAADFSFIFVGSLEPKQIEEFSKRYIASLPGKGKKENFIYHDFDFPEGKQELEFKKGSEPKSKVDISYRTEAVYDAKDAYLMEAAGEILSIKLIENLREGESGVYGVRANGYGSKTPTGVYGLSISFPCGPENVEKLKTAAMDELSKLIENGPDEKELNKIKEAQKLELKEGLKTNGFWMGQLYGALSDGEKPKAEMLPSIEKIEALTSKDIQRALKKYIGDDVIISVLMPEG